MLEDSSPYFDLKRYFRYILSNIYRVASIVSLFLFLWLIYYTQSPKIYQIQSLIQIKDISYGNSGSSSIESILSGSGQRSNLDEEIKIYLSRSNLLKITDDLQINIGVNDSYFDIINNKDVIVNKFTSLDENLDEYFVYVQINDENTYDIFTSEKNIIQKNVPFNSLYTNNEFEINLKGINVEEYDKSLIKISNLKKDYIVEILSETLFLQKFNTSNSWNVFESLLKVSFNSANTEFAKKLINTANNVYLNDSINKNASEARKSLSFLDLRLDEVENNLKISQSDFNSFKSKNQSIDNSLEIELLMSSSEKLNDRINELDLKIAENKSLYNDTNQVIINLNTQKSILEDKRNQINDSIQNLPLIQQEYIDLFRKVEINQKIYEQLLTKRMEFAIIEASTLGGMRIIDNAYIDKKVSPQFISSFVSFFLVGAFLAISYALIRSIYFSAIQLPSEITDVYKNLKIFGVIEQTDTKLLEKDFASTKNSFRESVNGVTTNILHLLNKLDSNNNAKTIQIIGPTKGVGKTTITNSIAVTSAYRGKKTCVIDCDFKQGDIHKLYKLKTKSMNETIIEDINIEDFKVSENLYIVPRPRNAAEKALGIFESIKFEKMIENLKSQVDILIIDTPPLLSLSDGLALSSFSDIIVPVVRHNVTKLSDVSNLMAELQMSEIDIHGFVYNSFKKPQGYYGYDYYAYKYYGSTYYGYEASGEE